MSRRLIAPILTALAAALAGCATNGFQLSSQELTEAEADANLADMARAHAQGIEGTWLVSEWAPASCRWSKREPDTAKCLTRSRNPAGQWRFHQHHYRKTDSGWLLLY